MSKAEPSPPDAKKSAVEILATPAQYLHAVGERRAPLLARMGIYTLRDVLFNFPRDYQDFTQLRSVDQFEENTPLSFRGTIVEIDSRMTGGGKTMLGVLIEQEADQVRALWFNMPYMQRKLSQGQHVLLSGKARKSGQRWEMVHPRVEILDDETQMAQGRMLAVYSLTEGLNQAEMRRIEVAAVDEYASILDEVFPEEYMQQRGLLPIHEALRDIHHPDDAKQLDKARERFVYQELLVLQLALALRRAVTLNQCSAPQLEATAKIDGRIRRLFPFDLTKGQETAIEDIMRDMNQPYPMNRLLQGDVGSGKTVVAIYAVLLAVAHGHQAAIMAPTEILARQHYRVLGKFLEASHVRTGMLTGTITASARKQVVAGVAAGTLDVVIGTQALIQSDIQFANLGLVVIDEQHKFGVRQRAGLREAGSSPHYLVMTATPIPRSIAMTMFADLEVSTIRDHPPGRQKISTYLAEPNQRLKWWEFVRKKLDEGRQAFVIAPLVEESEQIDVANVESTYRELSEGQLKGYRLGLIHGRMSGAEKDAAMADFHDGKIQVLVSTSVVEVGIDVHNASLMTIEGAERFGLAALHQLRGRIGRGNHPGFCTLFANPSTEDSQKRLESFVASTDGFELAEVDFALRGPGNLLGTEQHGLPPLRIADLVRDQSVVEVARSDAQEMVAADPGLRDARHNRLRKMVITRYGKELDLGDVG